VFPREIENQLMQHPKVLDVQVFGVPDAKYGEEIAAWVILQDGQTAEAEEFMEFCRSRMAHYKTPRYLRIVREFPLTATGKPQKFQMRQRMLEELGLHSPQTA
jgi:fatty-acyl-CoA synthase